VIVCALGDLLNGTERRIHSLFAPVRIRNLSMIASACRLHSLRAFSLLEILLVLGLLGGIVMALVVLFPSEIKKEKEGEETRSNLIASGVMEALTPSKRDGFFRLASAMHDGLPVWEKLSQNDLTNIAIAYDASCEPVTKLSLAEAELPVAQQNATDIIRLSLISNSSIPGMLTAEVAVSSPASAPSEQRTIRRYVRVISLP